MAKKEIRERGLGTVEKRNNSRNPYRAKVPVGQVIDENGKKHTRYETLGYFVCGNEDILNCGVIPNLMICVII